MKTLYILLLMPMLFLAACQEDNYELGSMLDKSQIRYQIVQDRNIDQGGNTVILINETPETIAMWDFGTGRSNRTIDTVRFPFQGEYLIKFSALTAGGIVEMDPVLIEVTEDNLNYVNDPLWTLLTGGPGNEKTWLLDGDENGDSKYFSSPMYFAGEENVFGEFDGTNLVWEKECRIPDGPDAVCFAYEPNWKNDIWVGLVGDYGTMTISLKGGPFIQSDHKMIPGRGIESGTFFLDVDNKMLNLTDATPLHIPWVPDNAASLYNLKLISLSENTMQLGVKDKAKTEYIVLNFISKEYSDNWVPDEGGEEEPSGPDEGFDPVFAPGQLLNMLTGGTSSARIWKLDSEGNPVDWVASGNGWTSSRDNSWDWGWNPSWDEVATNSYILFDSFGGQNYIRSQNGIITSGTFTINEDTNEINLGSNTLIQNPGHWMNPSANIIKVVKAFPGESETKGIWFGTSYDADKDEWLVFHYIIK